jgi:hypothetical protein
VLLAFPCMSLGVAGFALLGVTQELLRPWTPALL